MPKTLTFFSKGCELLQFWNKLVFFTKFANLSKQCNEKTKKTFIITVLLYSFSFLNLLLLGKNGWCQTHIKSSWLFDAERLKLKVLDPTLLPISEASRKVKQTSSHMIVTEELWVHLGILLPAWVFIKSSDAVLPVVIYACLCPLETSFTPSERLSYLSIRLSVTSLLGFFLLGIILIWSLLEKNKQKKNEKMELKDVLLYMHSNV